MINAEKKRRTGSVSSRLWWNIPPKQIYDFAIFELSIRAFNIQSGWRGAYKRQREYITRDLFMGKLNPEKFSQRLQDLNRYLDFIPVEETSDNQKITKAYGKSFPEDEIRSITGRAIPPEWIMSFICASVINHDITKVMGQ
jgi:hypothetical protein